MSQPWSMARRAGVLLLMALLVVSLTSACGPEDNEQDAGWQVVAAEGAAALLSVAGTAQDDVWIVGADKGDGPVVLHLGADGWERLRTGSRGDLWWVHAIGRGEVLVGGERSSILRFDGSGWTRQRTPGLAQHTVFGVWARSSTEAWAVGAVAGRNGFIWRLDGEEWVDVPLPPDVPLDPSGNLPGIFKVWGDQHATWFVGSRGLLLRDAGQGLELLPTGWNGTIFTVHGGGDAVVAVGGGVGGGLLEIGPDGGVADVAPEGTPLLQGVFIGPDGAGWAAGQGGFIMRRARGSWRSVETGVDVDAESLHAVWMDPGGGAWAVGGNVLGARLDAGVVLHYGAAVAPIPAALLAAPPPAEEPEACPADAVDLAPGASIAHQWNEQALNAIRRDLPRPGVHARNLWHVAVAMYDAWAAYDEVADGIVYTARESAPDVAAARDIAVAYAARRLLRHRYDTSRAVGAELSALCFDALLEHQGLDPAFEGVDGDSPAAVGNRIGQAVIDRFADDGANEAGNYADTTGWSPTNGPMLVDMPGPGRVVDPGIWQQLNLAEAVSQNGIPQGSGAQEYVGANWGEVEPFALTRPAGSETYGNPPADVIPVFEHPEMGRWVLDVLRTSSALDPSDGVVVDAGPAGLGNHPLGTNDGSGYDANPVTGLPYTPNPVLRADFGRLLAEYWADGPRSETPPGHWNTIANDVVRDPRFVTAWRGEGAALDALEYDVKLYVALNGATHDAAIAAWELKRYYLAARPITLIRHMASLGQSSEPELPSFHEDGLPLEPGLVELITEESSAPGQRHAHLSRFVGQVAVRSWRGEPGDADLELGGVGWIRGVEWMPYQLRTFVTPGFPGFISGHSTFSRAAAEVLSMVTGSEFFPGGLGQAAFEPGYLRFELGPSEEIVLQWATYFDAADQAGQSRIWGGIHVEPDDLFGRITGAEVGRASLALAERYFSGSIR